MDRNEEAKKLVKELTGYEVYVYVMDIEKLHDAEDIPYTLYLFDKGYEWFAHMRLDYAMSYSHGKTVEEAIVKVFDDNEEVG